MVLSIVLASVLAPWLSPTTPDAYSSTALLAPPSRSHPLGTDYLGRDLLTQVLYGARLSLKVGAGATVLAGLIGIPMGLLSGQAGGSVDFALMRAVDLIVVFPAIVLSMVIAVLLGPGLWTVIIALGVVATPSFARLIRGQVLIVREQEYVKAVVALGATELRILIRHLLPNVLHLVAVQSAITMADALLTEASLSFLGFGIPPPTPSWGRLLREGTAYLDVSPWMSLGAGCAMFVTILAFYLLAGSARGLLTNEAHRDTF
jgi:peptide/nickel transport system permease protein